MRDALCGFDIAGFVDDLQLKVFELLPGIISFDGFDHGGDLFGRFLQQRGRGIGHVGGPGLPDHIVGLGLIDVQEIRDGIGPLAIEIGGLDGAEFGQLL